MRRRKAAAQLGPGDVLIGTTAPCVDMPAAEGFDPQLARSFLTLLEARYGGGLDFGAFLAEREPTVEEATLARIVGTAVGTAVEVGRGPGLAVRTAQEGVLTALRFIDNARLEPPEESE